MFVIKYYAEGRQPEYFGDKRVKSKKCAYAFGENLRNQFKAVESEHCKLENIKVSDVAEMMYADKWIKVGKIIW